MSVYTMYDCVCVCARDTFMNEKIYVRLHVSKIFPHLAFAEWPHLRIVAFNWNSDDEK